jgi:hypothetical protein
MRHIVLLVALVGCVDDELDELDELDDEGEHTAYEISTHNPDNCPGGSGGPEPGGGGLGKRGMLQRCYAGCDGGQETMEAFCRVLRDIRLRAGCWAIAKGSSVACKGWCYWHGGR